MSHKLTVCVVLKQRKTKTQLRLEIRQCCRRGDRCPGSYPRVHQSEAKVGQNHSDVDGCFTPADGQSFGQVAERIILRCCEFLCTLDILLGF